MSNTLIGYFWCFVAAMASAVASFLIKTSIEFADSALARVAFLGSACAVYALGFFLYAFALNRLPLTIAYPVMTASTIALVTLIGVGLFRETLSNLQLIGLALIVIGVFTVTHK